MSSSDRKMGSRKAEFTVPTEPRETNSIVFEWPLRGLKQMFDNSKTDQKSKVIKSTPFGGGRWTVLFYAQSGHEQFCSLYLNAEPLPAEKVHPMLANHAGSLDVSSRDLQGSSSKNKTDSSIEEKWTRKGLFRFTFNIQTMDDKTNLGTKEAHDHAFSHKTSNWGWAQFAKRDHVYYKNAEVIRDDGFLISVTITSSPERPKIANPTSHTVPPVLIKAMGSLLDDAEHSDVVFYLYPSRRRGGSHTKPRKDEVKKVYAIRKILSARSEYFHDMFESGFQEAEAEESSSEEEQTGSQSARGQQSPAHPHRSHHAAARAHVAKRGIDSEAEEQSVSRRSERDHHTALDDEDDEEQNVVMEDSDEDLEEIVYALARGSSGKEAHSPILRQRSPNEDADLGTGAEPQREQESGDDDEDGDDDEEHDYDEEDKRREGSDGRLQEGALETDEEGAANATGNDASPAASQRARPTHRKGSNRLPSMTYVDATSTPSFDLGQNQSGSGDDTVSPGDAGLRRSSQKAGAAATRGRHDTKRSLQAKEDINAFSAVIGRQQHKEVPRRKRRKVSIVDSAYPTFRALLFFLYTDSVEFAPLTSSFLPADVAADETPDNIAVGSLLLTSTTAAYGGSSRRSREPSGRYSEEMTKARKKRKAVIDIHCDQFPDRPSPCSAKAMYRLADKLDIPDLKKRAQDHIAMSLSIQNIVWEVFSGFTAQYPDILKMETDFLLKHWPQVKRINAMKSIFLRSSAHPGLAKVWPYLLDCLEYRQPEVDESEDVAA